MIQQWEKMEAITVRFNYTLLNNSKTALLEFGKE